jgi:PAS domain S-box-containing protein
MSGILCSLPRRARPWHKPLANARPSRILFGLAALLVLAIGALTTGLVLHFRSLAIAEAEREIGNLNLLLAEQTARSLQHVDFLLGAVAERFAAANPAERADRGHLIPRMAELIADTPQLRTMLIAGPDGQVRFATGTRENFAIADRSYFLAQRDGNPGLFISEPVSARGGLAGASIFVASRRLTRTDGTFDGVVAISLDPRYFYALLGPLDLRNASAVALIRADGTCLMRYPGAITTEPFCGNLGSLAEQVARTPADLYGDRDPESGEARRISYRRVGTLPVFSAVSLRTDTVLQQWRGEARVFVLGALFATAILCLLIFFLAKEVGRREQLAEALRASEERFRNWAEASSDWFWEQDENLRFTFVSSGVSSVLGRPPSGVLGRTRREIVAHGVSAERWRQHDDELAARRPFRDFRYQTVGKDGLLRTFSVSGKPVFGKAGEFRGYAGTARDVTAEIRAEQRLVEAKVDAEAASRTKSEFLAVVSHELRTPLNAIIGFSEVINCEILGPIGKAKYREYAGDIFAAGRHLLDLINNILDMSKIEARRMELSEEMVDLRSLAASCVKIVERQAAERRIALLTRIPEDLPLLHGDEMRVKQILLNLLSNAVKFTLSEGSVTLGARRTPEGRLEIIVADTGIGMTEAEIAVALEPFRQIESAHIRKHEGTGLGLPLVKAFVEMHGGTLELRSGRGEGTTVLVTMPAERVAAALPAEMGQRKAG